MKVCLIQPEYSTDYSKSDELLQWELEALAGCDESMDVIVLPEAADVPALAKTQEQFDNSVSKNTERILSAARETAARCHSLVFINATDLSHKKENTTFAYSPDGTLLGKYYKDHLTPGEAAGVRSEGASYSFESSSPYILEYDGIRYAFLTCYDFYFYENYANIARFAPDIIIGCSHQRSDTHHALELITSFASYQTNAYVLRASVSMGSDSPLGGCSMITTPKGEVLVNMKSEIGVATAEINPLDKYLKPAGFGNPDAPHWQYIEAGRRPFKYRPAGPALIADDSHLPYPRTCAHRGFNTIAPENSLPAYGAAVALGANEIEFDLWSTSDGELVSTHDAKLERTSDGEGYVFEHTYEELTKLDFGKNFAPEFEGLRIMRFEDVLKKFACHTIMNIHLKSRKKVEPLHTFSDEELGKIIALIKKYDCEKYVYFMTGDDGLMARLKELAPNIKRCMGGGDDKAAIVERAIKYECQKLQFFKPYYNQEMIDKAHAHGILCNIFWSDDPEETRMFLDMGIDTVLTNDYGRISQVVEAWKLEHQ